jgi:hypothetical protein
MSTNAAFVRPPWAQPAAISSVLVTPPTEEPLTLDEAKLRAGLDWAVGDPRDDLMNGFIAAARSQVEQDTGLALLTQTRDVTIYATITDGIFPLPVQALPVQSITTPSGARLTAADWSNWWTDWVATPPAPIYAGTWRIVSGWPTAADLKISAPLLVQAVGLLVAHYATLGRDLALADKRPPELVPYGYEAAIQPYRLVWVT